MSAVKIAVQMAARKHNVLFCAHPRSRIMEELKKYDIETVPIRLIRHFDPLSVFRISRLIRRRRIGIVHCHLSRDLAHMFWVKCFTPGLHIILDKQVSSGISKMDHYHRLIYKKISKVFALSRYLAQNIIDTCPVRADKVIVIPGGVRPQDYDVPSNIRRDQRGKLKIKDGCTVFGCVSRLDAQKGLMELVNAFSRLSKIDPDVRLVIVGEPTVGEPAFSDKLHGAIAVSGLGEKIVLTGYRADIPHLLSAFDVFVLPSYRESFGYVYIEAMASGLPVIAADGGGVPEVVENGVTGILTVPRDEEGLFKAMERLYTDEPLRKMLGLSGRRRVQKMYTDSHFTDRVENEYKKLLEDKRFDVR